MFNVLLRKQIRLYNTGQKVKIDTVIEHIICKKYISLQRMVNADNQTAFLLELCFPLSFMVHSLF